MGASIIVHHVMLYLLIAMAIISLLKMAVRVVTITAMPVLLRVYVASVVAAFVAIIVIWSL